MERTTAGGDAGRRALALGADGQAHQCRFPNRRLDPADQHHDAGAGGRGAPARRPAAAAIDTAGDCTLAVAASDAGAISRFGGGQETGDTEVLAEARSRGSAGATCAHNSGSRGRQRLRL